MTHFGNSGIVFPGGERETSEAGERALMAGADLLHLIALLERSAGSEQEASNEILQLILRCQKGLRAAAIVYGQVSDRIAQRRRYYRVTKTDFHAASLTAYDFLPNSYRQNPDGGVSVELSQLYRELQQSLEKLAYSLVILQADAGSDSQGMLAVVADFMAQWEHAARVARLIAVLARRNPDIQASFPGQFFPGIN